MLKLRVVLFLFAVLSAAEQQNARETMEPVMNEVHIDAT
jgi:hypothetical protein